MAVEVCGKYFDFMGLSYRIWNIYRYYNRKNKTKNEEKIKSMCEQIYKWGEFVIRIKLLLHPTTNQMTN